MILKRRRAFHCQQQQTHKMKKNQKQNTTKITTNAQREHERTHKNFLKIIKQTSQKKEACFHIGFYS